MWCPKTNVKCLLMMLLLLLAFGLVGMVGASDPQVLAACSVRGDLLVTYVGE